MMDKTWLTMREAAEVCNVSEGSLRRWCIAGAVNPECAKQFGRVWRFKKDIIEKEGIDVDMEKVREYFAKYNKKGR